MAASLERAIACGIDPNTLLICNIGFMIDLSCCIIVIFIYLLIDQYRNHLANFIRENITNEFGDESLNQWLYCICLDCFLRIQCSTRSEHYPQCLQRLAFQLVETLHKMWKTFCSFDIPHFKVFRLWKERWKKWNLQKWHGSSTALLHRHIDLIDVIGARGDGQFGTARPSFHSKFKRQMYLHRFIKYDTKLPISWLVI